MRLSVFISTILVLGLIETSTAQLNRSIPSEKPKLIVQLVVSQMRFDYISRYWDKFGDNGFKLLVNEGTYCRNARYNYLLTQAYPGLATIATGTNPSVHGIIADKWFNRNTGNEVEATADDKVNTVGGSFFSGKYSAKNLVTSTFGDELKLNNANSKVVSIALDAGSAILLGGHSANGMYWFDTEKGLWVSSSYYTDALPAWVDTFNSKGFAKLYTDREWKALQPIQKYEEADTAAVKSVEKKISLAEKLKGMMDGIIGKPQPKTDFKVLLENPYGNLLTKDLAIAAVVGENLGADEHPDLLCITFSANRFIGGKFGPHSIEMEDTYLRLDRELAHFLEFINSTVGKENCLFILTSDQGVASTPDYLEKSKIPGGYFDPKKAMILLGSYLNALYGQGNWITGYHDKQIYLNRKLIEDSNLNLADFQQKVADFMLEFSGVSNSTTAHNLQNGNFANGIMVKFQNSYNQRRSGDVIINLEPGWVERNGKVTSANSPYDYDSHVPLIFYGWKAKRKSVLNPVYINDLAPTLSILLGITWPNGATGTPIKEMIE
ncbi:MAG: alkaline phosphatase family protein [Tenuifilum sp.]|uniref:alkaline phosphatase family protein n=1 Tax=Tenuifilum sp. TaxID=2760880 RepID=UPI001B616A72|nr:alkaline phosphatase family protein [Bacteroidales bacterium]HOK61711.1 alkaline phosphatase family protein [Tenuifilum sp.]MBP9029028.1 alkaline phosphatase family protein [Bacteroidales bacterium]HOK86387.1 alkaline phosphatase family protein [Tenuifilum sp.]HON69896.1 alkaline phosphatase family protein [Tenuifilum sp.]